MRKSKKLYLIKRNEVAIKMAVFSLLMAVTGTAAHGQLLSGHVKYVETESSLFETTEMRAVGTDLAQWQGPLDIPYEFSRGVFTYRVTSIGVDAFKMQGITSLSLPPSCRTIGQGAFMYCSELKSVTMMRGLKFIEAVAFSGCSALSSVQLPPSIKFLGKEAFAQCSGLKEVTIGEDLEHMESGAFSRCTSLVTVTFEGNRLTAIPDECFYDDGQLDKIDIPMNVRSIGTRAFRYCQKLRVVRWGHVKTIGAEAFAMCNNLQYVISDNATPPAVAPDAFDIGTYTNATLLVPKGAAQAYRKNPNWNRFVKIEEG